ncbi:transposon Tf2-9 polyprotein [Trichonephila clavipes]|nr:transposon Tf2-9 polyprotein [Trichonephila clavipes]
MKHVDALIRHPVMNITYNEITAKIKNVQINDEYITTIKQLVDSSKVNDFQIRNDIPFKLVEGKELLVVPDSMQTEIIKRAHDRGHFAVAKTEQIITLDYYFPKLTSELVAIKRTQFDAGLKLRPKFYGPYRIKTVKPHDRYEVEKVGQHEGPYLTSTAVDFMKMWSTDEA